MYSVLQYSRELLCAINPNPMTLFARVCRFAESEFDIADLGMTLPGPTVGKYELMTIQ